MESIETFETIGPKADVIFEGKLAETPARDFCMELGPVNRIGIEPPADPTATAQEHAVTLREIIAAIRGLNGSELLGDQRELRQRRHRDGRLAIELVDRETGEILGEIPPREILQMAGELTSQRKEDE